MSRKGWAVTALLLSLTTSPLLADEGPPRFAEVNGFEFGERIMTSDQAVRYLEALEESSDRISTVEIGESFEGRRQVAGILTSADNHERLDEIRDNAQILGDPRQGEAELEDQPTIVWFAAAIHGNELSGAEGLLKLVEELVRAEDDDAIDEILANTVIIVDPVLNADGREAFVNYNHRRYGSEPRATPEDWANDTTPWEGLGFRTSHYFFDINRDWFAHTHPETRNRQDLIQEWRPQVAVDAHEMGPEVEFHVEPPTDPINPEFPDFATRWFEHFGDAYAEAFDQGRVDYTTRDIFNFFYPGYTTSWSSYQGAVGMLYEQGNTGGVMIEREDGSVRTLAEGAENQYTAFRAAIELAATERETLLREYHQAHEEAVNETDDVERYVLSSASRDPGLLAEAVALLKRNGVEVARLEEETRLRGSEDRYGERAGTVTVPAGSYIIEAAQPRQQLIRALLEPETPVPEAFLEEARERVDRGENPEFYDITAWSLPLLFDLEAWASSSGTGLDTRPVEEPPRHGNDLPEAEYAWVIHGDQTAAIAALNQLRNDGYRVSVAERSFELNGEAMPRGSVILMQGNNPDSLQDSLAEVVETYDLNVTGTDEGRTAGGDLPALGGADTFDVAEARVALLGEMPMHPYSFGWAWYTLEERWDIAATVLRTESIADTRMEQFDTLVIPDIFSAEALAERLGEQGVERLGNWLRDGGNLVVIGDAVDFAVDQLETVALQDGWSEDDNDEETVRTFDVPGAFFATDMDDRHWLSSGYEQAPPVLVNSDRLHRAPELPPSPARNDVLTYAEQDAPLAGHAWEESEDALPGGVFAWEESAGSGRVVAFPEDLNFRGYWLGVDRLFLNAVILGPSA